MSQENTIHQEIIAPGQPWSGVIKKGQILKIVDLQGNQGVDFLCYNAEHPEERYHAPNTLKASQDLKLTTGHILYSDEAKPMFEITADTYGGHDTIGGCCSEVSNLMLYGVANQPGCRENFLSALRDYHMDKRDIVPNINFFCNVPISADRTLETTVFVGSKTKPGAYVELLARMHALAVISNCPQVNNPCNDGKPTAIEIFILEKH